MITFQVQELKTKDSKDMTASEMTKAFPNVNGYLLGLSGVTRVFIREGKTNYLCKRRLS